MNKNYFAIERNQKCWDHVVIKDKNNNVMFDDYFDMTYDEMKSSENLEEFVVTMMETTDDGSGKDLIVTLVGEDDVFIWSIIIGNSGDDDLRYVLVDWKKDGKSYRYVPENTP